MSEKPEPPKTPMSNRVLEVKKESRIIGDFLEWLKAQGVVLCQRKTVIADHAQGVFRKEEVFVFAKICTKEEAVAGKLMDEAITHPATTENLLAVYFGIDFDELDREKALLDHWIRKMSGHDKEA